MGSQTITNGNGKWTKYLAGCLWAALVLFLSSLSGYVIANDQASRDRDTCLERNMTDLERRLENRMMQMQISQDKGFTEILVSIERLKIHEVSK